MTDHDSPLAGQKEHLDRLTAELFYGFEGVALDELSSEAGLWQGGYIPRQMAKVNELREVLGLPALGTIVEARR